MMRNLLPIGLILAALAAVALLLFDGREPADVLPGPDQSGAADEPAEAVDARTAVAADSTVRSVVEHEESDDAGGSPIDSWRVRVVGRVVDEAGRGVDAAEVRVRTQPDMFAMFARGGRGGPPDIDWRSIMREQASTGTAVARSDADGRYSFTTSVADGRTLEVAAVHGTRAPAGTRVDLDRFDDVSGDVTADDLVLDPGTAIRGVVVDDQARPIAGAVVEPTQSMRGRGGLGRGGFDGGGSSFAAALLPAVATDERGEFTFVAMPSGRWQLRADATGFLAAESDAFETDDGERPIELTISLSAGVPFAGTVVDEAGLPIAAARVAVESLTDERDDPGRFWRRLARNRHDDDLTVATDAGGRFAFDAVPTGPLRVEVTHDSYLTVEREPVDASVTSEITFTLAERLSIRGIVLDAATGQPIERFGITARSLDRGSPFERRGGRGRGGRDARPGPLGFGDREQDPERNAYLQLRLGGAGLVAGETPEPAPHPGGKFELRDLLPGRYALDVEAPGYVRVVADVVELSEDVARAVETTLQVPRGTTLRGVVVSAGDGRPIPRANVALQLPDPEIASAGADDRDGSRRSMRDMFRGGAGTNISRVTTDSAGTFEFPAVLPGEFAIEIRKRGYSTLELAPFFVTDDDAVQTVSFELSSGAEVFGRVLDFEPEQPLTVTFSHVETGRSHSARVDRTTGEYRVQALEPGGYFVDVSEPRDRPDRMRGGFAARLQAMAGRPPHVVLAAAEQLQHDVTRAPRDVGVVAGTVYENGQPRGGFEVGLERIDDGSAVADDRDQARLIERVTRRMARRRVQDDGTFQIPDVLPGTYRLEVTAGRDRGFGGRDDGALHSEQVVVVPGVELDLEIAFTTARLAFDVQGEGGVEPPRLAQLQIVLASEAGDAPVDAWQQLGSYRRLRVTAGTVEASVAPGAYRYAVTGIGVRTVTGEAHASAGALPIPLTIVAQSGAEFVAERDADGDGKLSRDELPEVLQRLMDRVDADGDGFATGAELETLRSQMAERVPRRADGPRERANPR